MLQASADAGAVAIDNLSGQTTDQTASASAEAEAVATSITPLPATTQCIQFNNTNYSGFLLYFVFGIQSADECCDLCSNQQYCNVFVWCGEQDGCDDGSGRIYPGSLCTLKYQDLEQGTDPAAYGAGPDVPWTSGIVTRTSLGFCIGFASAAASASATAGCGSIAYATAVATAVDSCGNKASASALAIAVGGTCPVTCEQSVESVKQAASDNGCESSQFNDAVNAASALCGATRYAELAAGICPAPSCEAAVASASAAASAGCDTIAYASSLAIAQTSCASAFASASATAIGGTCPTTCDDAVAAAVAASTASSAGCNSTEFISAQSTAIVVCGAQSYSAAAAAAVPGGICTLGNEQPVDDVAPPAVEEGTEFVGPLPDSLDINITPTSEGEIIGTDGDVITIGVPLPESLTEAPTTEVQQGEETAPVLVVDLVPAPEMEVQEEIVPVVDPELPEPEIVSTPPPSPTAPSTEIVSTPPPSPTAPSTEETQQQEQQQQQDQEQESAESETPPPPPPLPPQPESAPAPPPATLDQAGTVTDTSPPPPSPTENPPPPLVAQSSPPPSPSQNPPPPPTEQSPPPPQPPPPPPSAPAPKAEQAGSK